MDSVIQSLKGYHQLHSQHPSGYISSPGKEFLSYEQTYQQPNALKNNEGPPNLGKPDACITTATLPYFPGEPLQKENLSIQQVSQTKLKSPKNIEHSIPVSNVTKVSNIVSKLQKVIQQEGVENLAIPHVSLKKATSFQNIEHSIPVSNVTKVSNIVSKLQKVIQQEGVESLAFPHVSLKKATSFQNIEHSIPVSNVTKVSNIVSKLQKATQPEGVESLAIPHVSLEKATSFQNIEHSIPVSNVTKVSNIVSKLQKVIQQEGVESLATPHVPLEKATSFQNIEHSIPVSNVTKVSNIVSKLQKVIQQEGVESLATPHVPLEKATSFQNIEHSIPVSNVTKVSNIVSKLQKVTQPEGVENLAIPHVPLKKATSFQNIEHSIPVSNVTKVSNIVSKLQKVIQQEGVESLAIPHVSLKKATSFQNIEHLIPGSNVTKVSNIVSKLQKVTQQEGVESLATPHVPLKKATSLKNNKQALQVTTLSKTSTKLHNLTPQTFHVQKLAKSKSFQTIKQDLNGGQSSCEIPFEAPTLQTCIFKQNAKIESSSRRFLIGKMKDRESISQLVLSAKKGEWKNVWEVLDNKPHLVNCIPSERAWSVLHQAVWHNNVQAVMKILSYPACDPEIRTKQDQTCESGPGKKPVELAKSQQIKDILQSHQGRKVMNEEAPTMLPVDNMLNILGGCIHMTLSCNHGVLIPPRWPIEDHNTVHSIPYIMEAIFRHTNAGDNWIKARNNVSLTLQQYSKPLGDKLWRGDELVEDTKHKFFSRIIKLYTEDLRHICSVVNKMLRLQDTGLFQYQPTSLELSLCPYALLLNAILLHWQKLDGYTGLTYRSCSLTQEQASEYVQGQQFVWLSFSSSSKRKGAFLATNYSYDASAYEFIIDNGAYNLKWAPRGITNYSGFPMEEECLYPFGAKFQVTDVVFNQIQIRLIDY